MSDPPSAEHAEQGEVRGRFGRSGRALVRAARRQPGGRRAGLCLVPLLLIGFYWLQPESYPWLAGAILGIALLACLALALAERADERSDLVLALGTGLLVWGAYVRTLSPTTDFADSEEFQFVAYRLYLAHPPGYPVYTLLGKLFTMLPVGDVAYRMNLFSACAAAAAVSMVFLIAARLTRCRPAALVAALLFAFTPAFWSQAVITEVYALNALIVGCVLYGLVRWTEAAAPGQPRSSSWLLFSVFVFALGALHHLTIIFVAPVLAGVVLVNAPRTLRDPRQLARLAAACALGLLPVLYFFARWPVVFGSPAEPVEVLRYVTARGYSSLFDPGWPVRDLSRWLVYRYELLAQFNVLALALALAGMVWLGRRRAQWALWLGLIYLLYTGFRLGYNAWDGWVVLVPAHLALAVCIAAGLTGLAGLVPQGTGERRIGGRAALFWTLATLLVVGQLWRNGPAADQSEGWPDYAANRRVLDLALPEGATIVVAPRLGSALLYGHLIEGARPDLSIAYADWPSGRRVLRDPETAGGPVYLLGLAPEAGGDHHYRALGPLIEIGREPRYDPGPISHPAKLPELGPRAPIELLGYDLDPPAADLPRPGEALGITLHWRAPDRVPAVGLGTGTPGGGTGGGDVGVRLRLARRGTGLPGDIAEPLVAGSYPLPLWSAGEVVPDYHRLPIDVTAQPGEYDLEIALDRVTSGETAAPRDASAPAIPPDAAGFGGDGTDRGGAGAIWHRIGSVEVGALGPDLAGLAGTPVDVEWSDRVRLVGYTAPRALRPGDPIELVLYWQRGRPAPASAPDAGPLVVEIDAGAAGRAEAALPGPDAWPEGRVIATRNTVSVPRGAQAGTLDVTLAVSESGRSLPQHASKSLLSRRTAYRLAPISIRTDLSGLDAAQTFADGIRLVGLGADRIVQPGERIYVGLGWEAYAPPRGRYKASLQLLDAQGASRAGTDREILFGTRPTSTWAQGERMDDVMPLKLPDDLPPGGYSLQLVLYDQATGERLPVLDARRRPAADRLLFGLAVRPESVPPIAHPVSAAFGDEIALRGYHLDPGAGLGPGRPLTITLRLAALRPPSEDYTLFAHLLRGEELVAQWDGQPLGGAFPTRLWPPGEALDVPIALGVPPVLAPGAYRLAVGWYNLATGQRLPISGADAAAGGDRFLIDGITAP